MKVDILNGKPIQHADIGERLIIHENHANDAEVLSIDDGRRFVLDKSSLKRLICTKKYILRFISSLENDVLRSEKLFLLLLHHFCLNKTLNEVTESAWSTAKYNFFNNFIDIKCQCTDENFTAEIAIKCEYWFGFCVPLYPKTLMLIESERLATFQGRWPHRWFYASTDEMAKCGLYFTGINDNVECAFCTVMLHSWQIGDVPTKEHSKYSPKCPFLYDFRKTSNVSDIGDIRELDDLIALLPNERGIDEVDR